MNEHERAELQRLRQEHARLERDLADLSGRLGRLEARLRTEHESSGSPAAAFPRQPETPPLHAAHQAAAPQIEPQPKPSPAVPPPIPQIVPLSKSVGVREAEPAPATPGAPERSFELRLGTYWLVRIGIVMLLTGLVFFGNYAYQNFIGKLGPGGKVSLLYLASVILLGFGAWWQRQTVKESLKNYAQVLFAGGLAGVYFTTYAAHHVENLRIIHSALVDGALLLGWAGFMAWVADRRKSEVLALFAVGLAYYTSVITRVGSFTLYSNLVLTLAAVFFLVRNRWAALSFASLAATYVSYAFWRFFDGRAWQWASPGEGLWFGTYFLMSYWIVFTAAVFLSRDRQFAGPNRAGFLTANNVAFFAMFLLTMLQVRHGGFWKFCLSYGTVLLILAEATRRLLPTEPLAKNAYLTQGLLLGTVGIIFKFTGLQLALLLAAESVVLLTLGNQRKNFILQIGAWICGALAIGWGIEGLTDFPRYHVPGVFLGASIGALLAFNAYWSHRGTPEPESGMPRAVPSYFIFLAMVIWLATTWRNTSATAFPLVLAMEALALTLSVHVLRVREVALFGQGYLVLAQMAWLFHHIVTPASLPPWWNPLLLLAITLAASHWWQRQTMFMRVPQAALFWQAVYALAFVCVLYVWFDGKLARPHWLAAGSLLAIGMTAYGVFTRAWFMAAFAQSFLLLAAGHFAFQLWSGKPGWHLPLAPAAALLFFSLAAVKWFERKPDSTGRIAPPILGLAMLYRWMASLMLLWWVFEYVAARERTWVLAALGLGLFLWAGWRRNREGLLFSAMFTGVALAVFWLPFDGAPRVYWPNLLAVLALPAQQRIAVNYPEHYGVERAVHGAVIVAGGLTLWLFLTRWVLDGPGAFYLTASWAAFALVLFTCGIVVRERIYRWIGLGVLACALGRVIIIDVWKLDTLYRILSFMALGIVLLVLGYIYSKYQEKIREWL